MLGGMGALASAEFLRSIYELGEGRPEQDAPTVALYSDPAFPDRTRALLRGDDAMLLARLLDALGRLQDLGATRIVICCMTLHHLLPRLPRGTRSRIVSLLDVIFREAQARPERRLVVCSSGTRRLELFERHPSWRVTKDRFVFPGEDEQERLHELIYEIKAGRSVGTMIALIRSLMARHRAGGFVAACSELHIVAKRMSERSSGRKETSERSPGSETRRRSGRGESSRRTLDRIIDPLAIIAREWAAPHRPNPASETRDTTDGRSGAASTTVRS